jgi:hypothetical protein
MDMSSIPRISSTHVRARHMRLDVAHILKRFFFSERALIIAQAGWLAGIDALDIKVALSRHLWEDALVADALRTRVFELRFPSRLLEPGDDRPAIQIFESAINAPSAMAFVLALGRVFKPALAKAYRAYLVAGDELADGPTLRYLKLAVQEKEQQIEELTTFATTLLSQASPSERHSTEAWVTALDTYLQQTGGFSLEAPRPLAEPFELPGWRAFRLAEIPARDSRFIRCRFYWPNIIDPDFPYGQGLLLQLRSAISHLNEVWALETGGAILHAFADTLDWEFILDAARWTYDEARHTNMGYQRLMQWGFQPEELPLGSYIFDSARGQAPIIRLGMLHYFETKNIGKKSQRAEEFAVIDDHVSQHDMEFDWADETIHAHYGSKWLTALHEIDPDAYPDRHVLGKRCDQLVANIVATATDAERRAISDVAQSIIEKARRIRA